MTQSSDEQLFDRNESISPMDSVAASILVVDDEKHIRRTLRHMLKKLGYRVWLAEDGRHAIEVLQQQDIDLVISDINMPEMTGIDLVRILKNSHRPPEVLLITGEPSVESATSAVKLGVFDYVSKPLDPEILIHTVHRAIEKKQLLDQKEALERENQRYQKELESVLDRRTYRLVQTEEKYRGLFENANIGLVILDEDLIILESNPTFSKLTGYSPQVLKGLDLDQLILHRTHVDTLKARLEELDKVDQFEVEVKRKGGSEFWSSITMKSIKYREKPAVLLTMLDVTQRKQYEWGLKQALSDKEEMLREIHHRTKNNMNVIISILNLQAHSAEAEEVKYILNKVTDRIYAMSLVHEQVYVSETMAHIDLGSYLKSMVARHYSSTEMGTAHIELRQSYAEVCIGLSQAVPLGLILNEILSNAMKHPFPSGQSGYIEISMQELEHQRIQIQIRDNGVGMPPDMNLQEPKTLGLHMVKILTEDQLGGHLSIQSDQGVTVRIVFELDPISATSEG